MEFTWVCLIKPVVIARGMRPLWDFHSPCGESDSALFTLVAISYNPE